MIQRIQSLYFFLGAVLTSLFFFLEVAGLNFRGIGYKLYLSHIEGSELIPLGNEVLVASVVLVIVAFLATIFQFKKRKIQLLMVKINYLFITAIVGGVYLYLCTASGELGEGVEMEVGLALYAIPLLLILNFLGGRAVAKDEALIRSVDRLR